MQKKDQILFILLALLIAGQWVMIAQQDIELKTRRIPENRIVELIEQSCLNEHRLRSVTEQNATLTSRTLTILERVSTSQPFKPFVGPDEPLVIYEAAPAKPAAKNGRQR